MTLIKEPLDVDFVVDPRPLTKAEEKNHHPADHQHGQHGGEKEGEGLLHRFSIRARRDAQDCAPSHLKGRC